MSVVKWRNPGLIPSFSSMIDNFFMDDDGFFNGGSKKNFNFPPVNVKETEEAFLLEFAAPGFKKDDFKIEIKDNVLTVSSECEMEKEEKEDDYTRKEFSYTSFTRSFWLPEHPDEKKIEANYKEGVLHLTIPKLNITEKEPVKTIKVS